MVHLAILVIGVNDGRKTGDFRRITRENFN